VSGFDATGESETKPGFDLSSAMGRDSCALAPGMVGSSRTLPKSQLRAEAAAADRLRPSRRDAPSRQLVAIASLPDRRRTRGLLIREARASAPSLVPGLPAFLALPAFPALLVFPALHRRVRHSRRQRRRVLRPVHQISAK
jgi:hypothetical protein